MRRLQRRAYMVVAIVGALLLGALLGAAAVSTVPASGDISVQPNTGVVVTYESVSEVPSGNIFRDTDADGTTDSVITADGGTIGGTGGSIDFDPPLTGSTYASANDLQPGGNTLYINASGRQRIKLRDDPLSFFDYKAIDFSAGNTDIRWSGSTSASTLILTDVPSSDGVKVVESGTITDYNDTVSGTTTLSLEHEPFESGEADLVAFDSTAPTIDNASPTRNVSDDPVTLEADIGDRDLPADNVSVVIKLDGSQVHQEWVNSTNTTVSTTLNTVTAGPHDWSVVATDRYGEQTTANYTFGVPDTLFIRNQTNATQLVDNTQVTVRFFNGTEIINRTTTDGTVDMRGLPANKRLIVTANADGYHRQTVLLDSLIEEQDVYLLNETKGVEVRFELKDRSGDFPQDSVLFIELPINQSGTLQYETIVADRFGPDGVTTFLQEGERHRLKIRNPEKDVRILGAFTPTVSETVVLEIGDVTIRNAADGSIYDWDAAYAEDSNGNAEISFDYADPENATSDLRVRIFERGNESNEILDTTIQGPLGNASVTQPLTGNQKNLTWVVTFAGDRNGNRIEGRRVVGDDVNLGVPVDAMWRNTASVALIVIVGGAMGGISAPLAAIATALLGGVLWFIGWVPAGVGGGAVALALLIAVGFSLFTRR